MTVAGPQSRRYTVEEYLRIERDSTEKHKYCDGEIVELTSVTVAHSRIISNCIRELGHRLRGGPSQPPTLANP